MVERKKNKGKVVQEWVREIDVIGLLNYNLRLILYDYLSVLCVEMNEVCMLYYDTRENDDI